MTIKERIEQLEATFQQFVQARDKAMQEAQNAARSMDQITGALSVLRELEQEQSEA